MMRRREFIATGGATLFAPRVGLAQARLPRVILFSANYPLAEMTMQSNNPQFLLFGSMLREAAQLGLIEGRTVGYERYSGAGKTSDEYTAQMVAAVATKPDLIVAHGSSIVVAALQKATATIPILFNVTDAVSAGLVPNLAHPGGNVSGSNSTPGVEIEGKSMQILRDALPSVRRLGYLVNSRPSWEGVQVGPDVRGVIEPTAAQLGLELVPLFTDPPVVEGSFAPVIAAARERIDCLQVGYGTSNNAFAPTLGALALEAKLPAVDSYRNFAAAGGLLEYANNNVTATYTRLADYMIRILAGTKAGDLPVIQPAVFDLTINLKTAKAIGVSVPPQVVAQATQVIE